MRLLIASALSLPLALAATGCEDPSENVTAAKVGKTKEGVEAAGQAVKKAMDVAGAKKFAFSGENSKVGFVGSKVTGSHDGGFKTFSGVVGVDNARVVAVNVEIDMDSTFSDSEKLTGHLKSPDFFNVKANPKAMFSSTKIEGGADGKATITGDLTLNGIKKAITFPATIKVGTDTVNVDSEFSINRRDFNINYAGKANDLIRDGVVIKLDIDAKEKK